MTTKTIHDKQMENIKTLLKNLGICSVCNSPPKVEYVSETTEYNKVLFIMFNLGCGCHSRKVFIQIKQSGMFINFVEIIIKRITHMLGNIKKWDEFRPRSEEPMREYDD